MIARLKAYVNNRIVKYKKELYIKALEEIDDESTTIEQYPEFLAEFWRSFDISLIAKTPTKELMYIVTNLQHKNIVELIMVLQGITAAIGREDNRYIEEVARDYFRVEVDSNLDQYFTDRNGGAIDLEEALRTLQNRLTRHGDFLETVKTASYRRQLNRMYQDIFNLTTILVNTIKVN